MDESSKVRESNEDSMAFSTIQHSEDALPNALPLDIAAFQDLAGGEERITSIAVIISCGGSKRAMFAVFPTPTILVALVLMFPGGVGIQQTYELKDCYSLLQR